MAYWVKGVAEGGSNDYIEAISETLNQLATLFPEGRLFIQLIYDVATLAGLQAVMDSINSMLSTLNGALSESCNFEKELKQVQYLISVAMTEIGDNKLRVDVGKPPNVKELNEKALLLSSEIGRLQHLVAYKVVNCLAMAFSTVQALQQALAQARQNQPSQPSGQNQPAPTAKATGTG